MKNVRFDAARPCCVPGCPQDATLLAASGSGTDDADHYCEAHGLAVAEGTQPEYIVDCPNCACRFGVN